MWKYFVVMLLLFGSNNGMAAEFLVSRMSPGLLQIELQGDIRNGDHGRLMSLIENSPISFINARAIVLNSKGGSVTEAIRIAEIVERASLATIVGPGDVCASACFLIFVSGPIRWNQGDILIHRPYLPKSTYANNELSEITKSQRAAMSNVRMFLRERSVPTKFIDLLISQSSTEAYRLTPYDEVEVGIMTPSYEEAVIAKCGLSSQMVLKQRATEAQMNCSHELNTGARLQFLKEAVGEEIFYSALREVLLSKGGIELPDGRIVMPKNK